VTTLDNLRKSAKRWLKSLREGDREAHARLARAYPDAPKRPTLRDVQHALARERGHDSWIALTRGSPIGPPRRRRFSRCFRRRGKVTPRPSPPSSMNIPASSTTVECCPAIRVSERRCTSALDTKPW
jgi:hypothetical protein